MESVFLIAAPSVLAGLWVIAGLAMAYVVLSGD